MLGIISYGAYLPRYRIKVEDICKSHGSDARQVKKSLFLYEKTVASVDEDSLTMAYEASIDAISQGNISIEDIGAVFFASENPVYAVKPTSTILASFLGLKNNYLASDQQFACKAATGALIHALSLVRSGFCNYSLVSASDKATSSPGDVLEYSASSAAVSLVVGRKDPILEVVDYLSFSSNTPDFFRRSQMLYPTHTGRFTGKPAYFRHIQQASRLLLKRSKLSPDRFSYVVLHMPNGKFPRRAALSLGFEYKQLRDSLVVEELGNPYTASSLLGLVAVLDKAKKGDLIFFCSYGSGAGADAFIFRVRKDLGGNKRFKRLKSKSRYINYTTYLKFMRSI